MCRAGSRAAAGVDHRASKAANLPRCRRSMARTLLEFGFGVWGPRSRNQTMRVLHLSDRLSLRGGAHRHLRGIVDWLARHGHDVQVAAGADEGAGLACPTSLVPGLEARSDAAVDLQPLMDSFRPDVVHLHTVVNPCVLEWAQGRRALLTVQDHRYFCPGKGKWTLSGEVCSVAMSEEACRAC